MRVKKNKFIVLNLNFQRLKALPYVVFAGKIQALSMMGLQAVES